MFFETSAKDGSNVKTLFNELAKRLIGTVREEIEISKKGYKLKDVLDDSDTYKNPDGKMAYVRGKCYC